MNLHPLSLDEIPTGMPLPWQIVDNQGYTVFARGEVIDHPDRLRRALAHGLWRDLDALPDSPDEEWLEAADPAPGELFPPPGIRPQVGERLQLRLLARKTQASYLVHLIGYIRGRSILITAPHQDGLRVDLAEGELVEVRMLPGTDICVFHTAVQRVCVSPSHYLHLEYPARLRTQAPRSSPWAAVDLTAAAVSGSGAETFARIVNLSTHGAQVRAPDALGAPEDVLRFRVPIVVDDMKTVLELDGALHRTRHCAAGGAERFEHRVVFRDVAPEAALWIKCLVYQRIANGFTA